MGEVPRCPGVEGDGMARRGDLSTSAFSHLRLLAEDEQLLHEFVGGADDAA